MAVRRGLLLSVCGLGLGLPVTSCASHTSFAQLAADAQQVPVPQGVTFVREQRSVNDGPGFTTSTARQVTRRFANTEACPLLQQRWVAALRAAHRQYHLNAEPHLSGDSGLMEIVLDDRGENLGITVGSLNGDGSWISCTAPFVWSFENPS